MIEYVTIATIALLAAISPGPDFVIVAKHALTYNKKNAIMASIGIGVGILVHTTYCVLGLAIIISQSLLLFSALKYLGASYLIYLGIKSLLSKKNHLSVETRKKKHVTALMAFRDGVLTNVLNPKCTLFMLSVFTLVINPHTPMLKEIAFGIEIALITCLWFVFLSIGLSLPFIQSKLETFQHMIDKVIGAVLVGLGIYVLFESR